MMGSSIATWWQADRAYFQGCRLARAGKPGEAAKAFERVIEISPKHARAQIQRALALAAAGRVGEAVRAARQAAEIAPRNHAPLLMLGQIQYDAGHFEEAKKAFSAAARLDPENRKVKTYLGLTMLAMGQVQQGMELLQAHLAYGYEEVEARALVFAEQYLWEHKEKSRNLEAQLSPDEGGKPAAAGKRELRAGIGLRLLSVIRRILLFPLARIRGKATVLMLRASESMFIGDFEAAITALHEAEKEGAEASQVALSLGQAYLEIGNPAAAAEQFSRLSEELRNAPDIALLLGAALFDAGRHEEASQPLTIAAEHFTRDFIPSYYRGLSEIALGQPKAALSWFIQACARLNPHIAKKRLEEMARVWQEK